MVIVDLVLQPPLCFTMELLMAKKPGIYTSWGLCYNHTKKVSGILFKGFSDIEECLEFMDEHSSVDKADLMVYEEGCGKGK